MVKGLSNSLLYCIGRAYSDDRIIHVKQPATVANCISYVGQRDIVPRFIHCES